MPGHTYHHSCLLAVLPRIPPLSLGYNHKDNYRVCLANLSHPTMSENEAAEAVPIQDEAEAEAEAEPVDMKKPAQKQASTESSSKESRTKESSSKESSRKESSSRSQLGQKQMLPREKKEADKKKKETKGNKRNKKEEAFKPQAQKIKAWVSRDDRLLTWRELEDGKTFTVASFQEFMSKLMKQCFSMRLSSSLRPF